jgi:hypothetical protein
MPGINNKDDGTGDRDACGVCCMLFFVMLLTFLVRMNSVKRSIGGMCGFKAVLDYSRLQRL